MPIHTAGMPGYINAAALAQTPAQQLQLTDAALKRLMAAGFTQAVPNVARLTGQNVAKRTLAPTRVTTVSPDPTAVGGTAVGGDFIADLDLALQGASPTLLFPFQLWSNQIAADREETEGEYLAGVQVGVAVTAAPGAAVAAVGSQSMGDLADALEQQIMLAYGLAIFPTSGVQSPLVANTPLREFGETHRLSGPDGYRGIPPVRWSDNFAHIDLLQSPGLAGVGGRPVILNQGQIVAWTVTIACRLRTFAG
jgi:hypothetical protein